MVFSLKRSIFIVVAVAVSGFIALACENVPDSTPSPAPLNSPVPDSSVMKVVTTSNIVGDWVKVIGGERVEVFNLMPANTDPHTFQPGARDVTRVSDADVVIQVGLMLEASWFEDLVQNAAADESKIVTLGEIVDPVEFDESGEHGHDVKEHEEGEFDPHFWLDPIRVKLAVTHIVARLSVIDSNGSNAYQANARAYNEELDTLHAWIEAQVESVPRERRQLVTSHDSFGYFADRYGFDVIGVVFPGGTTEREPSAQELANLVDAMKEHNASAIFAESSLSDRLVRRVAEETGARVVTEIYTGSLGDIDSGAETYIDFMRLNIGRIVEALK